MVRQHHFLWGAPSTPDVKTSVSKSSGSIFVSPRSRSWSHDGRSHDAAALASLSANRSFSRKSSKYTTSALNWKLNFSITLRDVRTWADLCDLDALIHHLVRHRVVQIDRHPPIQRKGGIRQHTANRWRQEDPHVRLVVGQHLATKQTAARPDSPSVRKLQSSPGPSSRRSSCGTGFLRHARNIVLAGIMESFLLLCMV